MIDYIFSDVITFRYPELAPIILSAIFFYSIYRFLGERCPEVTLIYVDDKCIKGLIAFCISLVFCVITTVDTWGISTIIATKILDALSLSFGIELLATLIRYIIAGLIEVVLALISRHLLRKYACNQ